MPHTKTNKMLEAEKTIRVEDLFKSHFHQLYVHAYGWVRDEENAKDIVHDAFCYLWENYERYEKEDNHLLALLYTLVRSRSIDYLRHSQSRENYIQEQIEFDDSNRSDYDDYDDILARIMGAIRRFPPQTRRIFTECILHHKSYKEVGELLNISPLTVKTVMARAFKALREQREFFIPAILLLLAGL